MAKILGINTTLGRQQKLTNPMQDRRDQYFKDKALQDRQKASDERATILFKQSQDEAASKKASESILSQGILGLKSNLRGAQDTFNDSNSTYDRVNITKLTANKDLSVGDMIRLDAYKASLLPEQLKLETNIAQRLASSNPGRADAGTQKVADNQFTINSAYDKLNKEFLPDEKDKSLITDEDRAAITNAAKNKKYQAKLKSLNDNLYSTFGNGVEVSDMGSMQISGLASNADIYNSALKTINNDPRLSNLTIVQKEAIAKKQADSERPVLSAAEIKSRIDQSTKIFEATTKAFGLNGKSGGNNTFNFGGGVTSGSTSSNFENLSNVTNGLIKDLELSNKTFFSDVKNPLTKDRITKLMAQAVANGRSTPAAAATFIKTQLIGAKDNFFFDESASVNSSFLDEKGNLNDKAYESLAEIPQGKSTTRFKVGNNSAAGSAADVSRFKQLLSGYTADVADIRAQGAGAAIDGDKVTLDKNKFGVVTAQQEAEAAQAKLNAVSLAKQKKTEAAAQKAQVDKWKKDSVEKPEQFKADVANYLKSDQYTAAQKDLFKKKLKSAGIDFESKSNIESVKEDAEVKVVVEELDKTIQKMDPKSLNVAFRQGHKFMEENTKGIDNYAKTRISANVTTILDKDNSGINKLNAYKNLLLLWGVDKVTDLMSVIQGVEVAKNEIRGNAAASVINFFRKGSDIDNVTDFRTRQEDK